VASAPLLFAMGLPDSLAGSTAFILVVLSITYALLRVLIKVEPVRRRAIETRDEDETPPPDESGEAVDSVDEPVPEEEVRPASFPAGPVDDQPRVRAVSVEALTVHGVHISVGDSAAHVMQAVRRRDSMSMPIIDKDDAGRATRVTREYKIEEQAIQFVFERDSPNTRLLLTDLQLH
jgi:hypothetical protein